MMLPVARRTITAANGNPGTRWAMAIARRSNRSCPPSGPDRLLDTGLLALSVREEALDNPKA